MTTTLERPIVETGEPLPQTPESEEPRRPDLVRWLGWLVGLAVVAAMVYTSTQFWMDPSYGIAEFNRFETSRLLGPISDVADVGISNAGEINRFEATQLLIPEILTGYDYAEFNRFQALQDLTPIS